MLRPSDPASAGRPMYFYFAIYRKEGVCPPRPTRLSSIPSLSPTPALRNNLPLLLHSAFPSVISQSHKYFNEARSEVPPRSITPYSRLSYPIMPTKYNPKSQIC